MEGLTLNNPVFSNFAFYSMAVVIKMFAMGFVTGYWRQRNKAYMTSEDVKVFGHEDPGKVKPTSADQDVERARNNHRNDLENIPSFILIGMFYVLIGPSQFVALWHFRLFFLSRVSHTICYQFHLQPHRALFHAVSLVVQVSMVTQVLMATSWY